MQCMLVVCNWECNGNGCIGRACRQRVRAVRCLLTSGARECVRMHANVRGLCAIWTTRVVCACACVIVARLCSSARRMTFVSRCGLMLMFIITE